MIAHSIVKRCYPARLPCVFIVLISSRRTKSSIGVMEKTTRKLPFVHIALSIQSLASMAQLMLSGSKHGTSNHSSNFMPVLTIRSSRPAYCGRLTLFVSTTENQFISPMLIQTAFNFSSVVQRLVCRFSGLRLVALRWFVVFLASGPCVASASSYFFS